MNFIKVLSAQLGFCLALNKNCLAWSWRAPLCFKKSKNTLNLLGYLNTGISWIYFTGRDKDEKRLSKKPSSVDRITRKFYIDKDTFKKIKGLKK
jgi:hypothetical protein